LSSSFDRKAHRLVETPARQSWPPDAAVGGSTEGLRSALAVGGVAPDYRPAR
jgi:hypothetical protein